MRKRYGSLFLGSKNHFADSERFSFGLCDFLLLSFITEKKRDWKRDKQKGALSQEKMDVCFVNVVALSKGVGRSEYSDN